MLRIWSHMSFWLVTTRSTEHTQQQILRIPYLECFFFNQKWKSDQIIWARMEQTVA